LKIGPQVNPFQTMALAEW